MKVVRVTENSQFKKIYVLDNGNAIKVPRYKATSLYIGSMSDAKIKGLKILEGDSDFYIFESGDGPKAVIRGYLGKEKDNMEFALDGIVLSKNNIEEFFDIIVEIMYK